MKKLIVIIMLCFPYAFGADAFDALYKKAEPFKGALYNDIDPFEDEDMIKYAYSPYPLFRTSAYLYFKDKKIPCGYYSITPRTLQGADYILFKQYGKVKFIIPAAKKELTPPNFYKAAIPQRKKTRWQKFSEAVRNKFYKLSKNSQKIPPPKSYIQTELNDTYIIVYVYYGMDKYTVIFKRTPY